MEPSQVKTAEHALAEERRLSHDKAGGFDNVRVAGWHTGHPGAR